MGANTSDNTKGITDHCTSNDTRASIISTSGANTSDNTKGITEHCTSNGISASIITSTPVRTTRSKSSQVFNQSHSSDSIVQLDGPNDPHDNKKDSKLSKQQNKSSKISNSNKYQFNSKKSNINSSTKSTPVIRSAHSNKASDSKHLPNKINNFFPKVSNLPPIVPLPKDVQVVGWKKNKKSKSKTKDTLPPPEIPIKPPPKSQSVSRKKKRVIHTYIW